MGVSPKSDGGAFIPFPVDVLPDPIRGFVNAAAKAIGCDASYIALPLLSGLASAIGNTHRIELKRSWTEPAIVWTAIVGKSGTSKSPAIEACLHPIRKRQHDAMKVHAEAMKEHAIALAMHERDKAKWMKSAEKTPPPIAPEAPIADRCWTDDVTTEAVAVLLEQNPRGLLMVKDELSGWFNFDAYKSSKGGDVAKWLEMFGGRPTVVDRKVGGTIYVPRAAVSIAGGIQPETLRRSLGVKNIENGLASRLLMAYPPQQCPGWMDDDIDARIEAALALVFVRLYDLTPDTANDGDQRPWEVTLADDGKREVVEWVNWHAKQMEHLSGPVGFAWAKLKGYAARLALVIHLTRWASGDESVPDPTTPVDKDSIAAGVALARWFGGEAKRVYAAMKQGGEDEHFRKLIEWIENRGGTCSVNDMVRDKREYRHNRDGAEADLMELVRRGAGEWDKRQKTGRPSQRFRLFSDNPVTETTESSAKVDSLGDSDTSEWSDDEGGEV